MFRSVWSTIQLRSGASSQPITGSFHFGVKSIMTERDGVFGVAVFGDEESGPGIWAEGGGVCASVGIESFPEEGGVQPLGVEEPAQAADGDAAEAAGPAHVAERVCALTGFDLRDAGGEGASWFRPERLLCRNFVRGRVILCGDAAHVMSPIGGQGMNTGFADASLLGRLLPARLAEPATLARYRANAASVNNRAVFEIPGILQRILDGAS